MPAVEFNLSHPSQAMRCATLRLLCCFEQPAMQHSSSSSSTPKPSAATLEASQILPMFLSIQSQTCTVDSGRQAAVTIGKVRTYLEYGQVPPDQVPAVIRCLLGVLHIRYDVSPNKQHSSYTWVFRCSGSASMPAFACTQFLLLILRQVHQSFKMKCCWVLP